MKGRIILFGLLLVLTLPLVQNCGKQDSNIINIPSGNGHEWLSQYNFHEGDLSNFIVKEGILPYDLNMPLFSDYASKKRFIYVPKGEIIPFDTSSVLNLPEGSVIIKHFYYSENDSDEHIETRLLLKRSNEWQAETYEWNSEQTDAKRIIVGKTKRLEILVNGQNRSFNYLIPNVNQCKNCHAYNGKIEIIGPRVHNLNKNYSYADGTKNQLEKWIDVGILDNAVLSTIHQWPSIEDNSDLDSKARAYLAVNCASCHRREGSASNSGFYLEYNNNDSASLGVWKTPVAAGSGSGGLTYVIKPGEADESILLYRMISNEINERMPEIGRDLSHEEGIELIRDWINTL